MSSKEPAPPSASWRWAKRVVPPFARRRIGGMRRWLRHRPPVGLVRFGSLRRVTPISRRWGYDRGLPIDRYYIEAFVEEHRRDIRGTVLEVREPGYTYQFGSDVKHSEVIDIDPDNTVATIVADLADAPQVPDASFDCVIVTQTLQLIYDVRAAVDTIHRILKPRGVVLATFPGISPVASEAEADHWRFTIESSNARVRRSVRRWGRRGSLLRERSHGDGVPVRPGIPGASGGRARRARPEVRTGRRRPRGPAVLTGAEGRSMDVQPVGSVTGCFTVSCAAVDRPKTKASPYSSPATTRSDR